MKWPLLAVLLGLAGCSAALEKMPRQWAASSVDCEDLSGTYDSAGMTLVSLLAPEVTLPGEVADPAVRIDMGSSGDASFTVERAENHVALASSRQWSCVAGVLTGQSGESFVRLWRSSDGALIVENTVESVERHLRRSRPVHRVRARGYFRFEAIRPVDALRRA